MPENSVVLKESDLTLIDALAADPRATWKEIGRAVDSDATTCARRWKRLEETRLAWLVAQPFSATGVSSSFIDLSCQPGHAATVGEQLSVLPSVTSAEMVLGDYDLHLTVLQSAAPSTVEVLDRELAAIPGVRRQRKQLILRTFKDGSRWRVGALEKAAYRRIDYDRTTRPIVSRYRPHALDRRIIALLLHDVRTPVRTMAERLDGNPTLIKRRIDILRQCGQIALRVDCARPYLPLSQSITLWASVPAPQLSDVGTMLAAEPQTRIVAETLGTEANLVFSLLVNQPAEASAVESHLLSQFPQVRVVDRAVGIRYFKRVMHLLGPDGRNAGTTDLPDTVTSSWQLDQPVE